jgi:tetratricopeptide (TPR) repeat protein
MSATETQAYARLAFRWHRTGHFDRACTMYELVLKTDPSPEMTFNLAVCLIRVGDYESALQRLGELQGKASEDSELDYNARYNRALAQRYLGRASALDDAEALARDLVDKLIEGNASKDSAVDRLAAPALMLYNAILLEAGQTTSDTNVKSPDLTELATGLLDHPPEPDDPAKEPDAVASERDALKKIRNLIPNENAATDDKVSANRSALLAEVPGYVRHYRQKERRARYNMACFLAAVANDLTAEEPALADQLLGEAVTDLRVAVSDLPLREWARADPALEPVREDPRGADLIAEPPPVAEEGPPDTPAAEDKEDSLDASKKPGHKPAAGSARSRGLASPPDPPPTVRDGAYWLDRDPSKLIALRLRPVREDGQDAFLATGWRGLVEFDESSELRRHVARDGTASLPGLEERLPAAVAFELGKTPAMLLSDSAVPELIAEQDQANAHRDEVLELAEYLISLIRRTEEDVQSGRARRLTGYPRDGLELSAWTGGEGEREPVVIGLRDPPDTVRRWLDDVLSG